MSNLTPIAPQFAASAPTTLVFKEKKGMIWTGKFVWATLSMHLGS